MTTLSSRTRSFAETQLLPLVPISLTFVAFCFVSLRADREESACGDSVEDLKPGSFINLFTYVYYYAREPISYLLLLFLLDFRYDIIDHIPAGALGTKFSQTYL